MIAHIVSVRRFERRNQVLRTPGKTKRRCEAASPTPSKLLDFVDCFGAALGFPTDDPLITNIFAALKTANHPEKSCAWREVNP
jgi:hypothetical protein